MPIAIYHLEAKVISRGVGRSAVAAAAYMSCSRILNDYDDILHDYTRKKGLVFQKVFLPENAPEEWQDRAVLWNAVEANEKTKDSRLAREFVIALPCEFAEDLQEDMISSFVEKQFVAKGMCADVCIHDTDGHNPHAHIMLTVRPLNENGTWQHKTEKEYLCIFDGEERGFTASEYLNAQKEGWEKQYLYKVGDKKIYLPPSKAEGLERVNKYPKSTKYGRQNPISEQWNSEEQLLAWREAWADYLNFNLECCELDTRVDHRSHAARGLVEQPTIHEGVVAIAIERKGFVSERCELNRQIRKDNSLLHSLSETVKYIWKIIQLAIPRLADAMEEARVNMLVFEYCRRKANSERVEMQQQVSHSKEILAQANTLIDQIHIKESEYTTLEAERKKTPFIFAAKRKEISAKLQELAEEIEELKSEKDRILTERFNCNSESDLPLIQSQISESEKEIDYLVEYESEYAEKYQDSLEEYKTLENEATEYDSAKLQKARLSIRDKKEAAAERKLKKMYGLCIYERFEDSLQTVAEHLGEEPLEETPRKQNLKEFFAEHRAMRKEKGSEKADHPKKRAHRDEEERL